MHAGCAPGGVFARHPLDHGSNSTRSTRPSDFLGPRAKPPIAAKRFSMPRNNGFRLNDQKRARPARKEAAQQNPQEAVGWMESCPFGAALQDRELVTQSNDFKSQIVTRSKEASHPGE